MRQSGTYTEPHYRYDISLLRKTLKKAKEASELHSTDLYYAVKANNEPTILKEIQQAGFGADCVSMEEIERALSIGFPKHKIVFAGSGKTVKEIDYATAQNIAVIHCESVEEYEIIQEFVAQYNSTTKIALRINPDLEAGTHSRISTGKKHHKFGMPWEDAIQLIENNKDIIGFHFHIGSQILDMSYFENLSSKIAELLLSTPLDFKTTYLNMGGGLGIDYENPTKNNIADFEGWMAAIRKNLPKSTYSIIGLEPGRSIVGQCGTLIGQVQYVKHRETCPTAILDIGMTDLLRPMLYGARHKVSTVNDSMTLIPQTISGPSCESTDVFGSNYYLPELNRGDIVRVHSAGAYGSSMRLGYNLKSPIKAFYTYNKSKTTFNANYKEHTKVAV